MTTSSKTRIVSALSGAAMAAFAVGAETAPAMANDNGRDIGEITTAWKLIGPNHKIKISGFEDPKVNGVTCFLSRPVTGGITGGLGLAEDKSDASIACRQTGPIVFKDAIEHDEDGEEVFNEKRSILFKGLHVTRFFDEASNSLVYLTHSDKLIDGSPKNAISAVTMMPWGTQAPGEAKLER